MDDMICPECKGEEVIRFVFPFTDLPCRHCRATGKVPKEMPGWIARGKEIRAERIARRVTLRDEAKRLIMDVVALSDIERGVVDNTGYKGER